MPSRPTRLSNDTRRLDIDHITGQVPYAVEQAILKLRDAIQFNADFLNKINARLDAMPPQLTLADIQRELSPTGSYPLPTAGLLNTTPPVTQPSENPAPPIEDGIPDHLAEVQAAATAFGINGATTDEQMFRFCQTAVENIIASGTDPVGLVCGLCLAPPAGSSVFACAGITYR